jgi:hypothetical protein
MKEYTMKEYTMKEYKPKYWSLTLPISIEIKEEEKNMLTRRLICEKFREEIKNYTGRDHEVVFEKIVRCPHTKEIKLNYTYESEPPSEGSIYGMLVKKMEDWMDAPITDFDLDNWLTNVNVKSNYANLSELQTIYIGMRYDQARSKEDGNDWDVLKYILKKRVKKLFTSRVDGSYHEFKQVEFKLGKLLQFNPNKYEFVNRRVKRLGMTLTNFSEASLDWDKEFKIKLNLDRAKSSVELRTDLALSGLNDNIV